MNELFCPGCGASVCDFVIYCPECGFALQEYLKKQKRQASDTFFSDVMPVSSEKEQKENSLPKENNTALKASKQKKGIWIAAVCALLLLTAVVMVFVFQNQGTSGRDSQRIHAPVITHSYWYDENNNHITRLESDVKEPFVAVYSNRKDDFSCVYFMDGVGEYLGGDLSQPIGSLPVDSSVQIDSINTFYQRYVESESDSLYVLNFDIVFNQNVDGLFLYDIYCDMDQPLYSSVSNYQYCFSGTVSVRDGQCRIIEKINVAADFTVKAELTPKCFVRTDGSFETKTKRLWGGQVKFLDFSNYSTAICEQIYSINESRYDPKNSIILYRYTLESGGDETERGKSTYYYRIADTDNRTDISHQQNFYRYTDVSKPTYSLDVFGIMSVMPFLDQQS